MVDGDRMGDDGMGYGYWSWIEGKECAFDVGHARWTVKIGHEKGCPTRRRLWCIRFSSHDRKLVEGMSKVWSLAVVE